MEISKVDVFGFEAAVRGMRNPLNSWSRSDSYTAINGFVLGEADKRLATNLIKAGTEHAKFLRFITVTADIELPLYVWKEFDTYKFVEKNSCSTMHKITSKQLDPEKDFEYDLLDTEDIYYIGHINELIKEYNNLPKEAVNNKQLIFRKIIQKLPSSFLQKRTVVTNYAELRNIYRQRKNHKLVEWHKICEWIESLPYAAELITADL